MVGGVLFQPAELRRDGVVVVVGRDFPRARDRGAVNIGARSAFAIGDRLAVFEDTLGCRGRFGVDNSLELRGRLAYICRVLFFDVDHGRRAVDLDVGIADQAEVDVAGGIDSHAADTAWREKGRTGKFRFDARRIELHHFGTFGDENVATHRVGRQRLLISRADLVTHRSAQGIDFEEPLEGMVDEDGSYAFPGSYGDIARGFNAREVRRVLRHRYGVGRREILVNASGGVAYIQSAIRITRHATWLDQRRVCSRCARAFLEFGELAQKGSGGGEDEGAPGFNLRNINVSLGSAAGAGRRDSDLHQLWKGDDKAFDHITAQGRKFIRRATGFEALDLAADSFRHRRNRATWTRPAGQPASVTRHLRHVGGRQLADEDYGVGDRIRQRTRRSTHAHIGPVDAGEPFQCRLHDRRTRTAGPADGKRSGFTAFEGKFEAAAGGTAFQRYALNLVNPDIGDVQIALIGRTSRGDRQRGRFRKAGFCGTAEG